MVDFIANMKQNRNIHGVFISKYSDETLMLTASKYSSPSEWKKKDCNSYCAAQRRGVLKSLTASMKRVYPEYTKEICTASAMLHQSPGEWAKADKGAYYAARRNGWFDECIAHMNYKITYWNDEMLQTEANKYSARSEWERKSPKSYAVALQRKMVDKLCTHMKRGATTSFYEQYLLDEVKKVYPKAQKLIVLEKQSDGSRRGFHIDIYVPELRKGVEFDGTYWHSVNGLRVGRPKWSDKDLEAYHETKDRFFRERNIAVIHITEKDWKVNRDECVSKVFSFLEYNERKS